MCKILSSEEVLELAIRSESEVQGGVDIVKIACDLGIEVHSVAECDQFFNAAIKYSSTENKFEILVNEKHSRNRVRFSIAHEIAHFVLHRDQIIKHGIMNRSLEDGKIEKEADKFAELLLIPETLLKKFVLKNNILKESEITKDQLNWISCHFRVSYIVAAIRLRNSGYKVPYISFAYMS